MLRAIQAHLAGVHERLALGGAEPGRHRDHAVHRWLALRRGLRDAPRVLQDARLQAPAKPAQLRSSSKLELEVSIDEYCSIANWHDKGMRD